MQVVLAGERLRDMTGLQLIESVKGSFPDLTCIIKASSSDTTVLREALAIGRIEHYLRHDADIYELTQVLRSALREAELKSDNRSLSSELKRQLHEQNRILELFKRYVPEQVVNQTLNYKEHEMLRGETRVVSVLFADIRNFTGLAARLSPAEVVTFLNDFWSALSEPVRRNHGSVNKLIGDGMLAIFGAPVSHIDNHENAVLCAIEMVQSLDQVNRKYSAIFGTEIKIGVGVNTGEVVVGNVGTSDHMEYTVIGDAVNIASRIESMTKTKHNSILISEDTWQLVNHMIEAVEGSQLTMEGKDQPIQLYEVISRRESNIKPLRRYSGF
jgi:adenylate cyclase